MTHEPIEIAHQIIRDGRYLAIATADSAGNPWCSPVFYGVTADLEFVFISSKSSRHASNLRETGKASWAIFWGDRPSETTDGVQFGGTSRELNEGPGALDYGNLLYDQRFPDPAERARYPVNLQVFSATGRSLYVLEPTEAYKVDHDDPHGVSRMALDLSELIATWGKR